MNATAVMVEETDEASGRVVVSSDKETVDLVITIGGDLYPVGKVANWLQACEVNEVFSDLTPHLYDSDLTLVNLESPLTMRGNPIAKSGPHLRAAPDCAAGIAKSGIDVVTLANNHILDMGEEGLLDTITTCQSVGIETVGAGRNLDEATTPLMLERKGVNIAVLAFAEHEFSIATADSAGAWPLDLVDNQAQIRWAKQHADFVLVILHGGAEYYSLPSPRMVKTCRSFVDSGANAVVCHHAHVPSGLEIYREAPIAYGIGNLLFEWPKSRPLGWYQGYLFELRMKSGIIQEIRLIPYFQSARKPGVRKMNREEARVFFGDINRLSTTLADNRALASSWDQFCWSHRSEYLSYVLCLSRLERHMLRLGIWPFWRMGRKQAGQLLNLLTCESHHEATVNILRRWWR